ncbi:MAG: hypothetical protein ABIO60_10095, partial [Aquaticitalea sp.]
MNKFFVIFCLLFSGSIFSQSEELTDDYFKRGEFEKALIGYRELYQQNPSNYNFFYQIIKTQQQLRNYEAVQLLLNEKMTIGQNPALVVELGYNYQLQDSSDLAKQYYDKALKTI